MQEVQVPKFLEMVGVCKVSLKDLGGADGYLWPTKDDEGNITRKKTHISMDSKLSDAGKLITFLHEYLHALFNNGGFRDPEGEKFIVDQEELVLKLLDITLPENEKVREI